MFQDLKKTFRKFWAVSPYWPRLIRLVAEACGPQMLVWIFLLMLQALCPVGLVYLTKTLVNGLVQAVSPSEASRNLMSLLIPAGLFGGLYLLSELRRMAVHWIENFQTEILKDHIFSKIHDKSAEVDLAFYDSPAYYDHLHRARNEASTRPLILMESLGGFFRGVMSLAAMGFILLPYGIHWPILLLLGTLPGFYVALMFTYQEHQWIYAITDKERHSWYYDWLLTAGETAQELRLFNLGGKFKKAFQDLRAWLRGEHLKLTQARIGAELAANLFFLGVVGVAMGLIGWRVFSGQATLGDAALFYQAFNQGQLLARSLLQDLSKVYSNSLFLGNLFEFLDLVPGVKDPEISLPAEKAEEGIRFDHVSFHYPKSERPIVKDLDFFIPAGKKIALIGPNGAGKSTLLKLLCRFYDPQEGRILLNGMNLRGLQLKTLRDQISMLFQEPVCYNATIEENIALALPDQSVDFSQIEAAAKAAGVDEIAARYPEGYQMKLGNWFEGGVELSVGERQRIALARAFLRKSPVLLLDEPTSAMDSWAEAAWLERFETLSQGRTVIMITHRLTTAMRADKIYLLSEGRITESGSHAELLALKGLYAKSWELQMRGSLTRGI